MKPFHGKAIYQPSGKAGEYSAWACNFYVGCSNGCTYCYCKQPPLSHTAGGDVPTLKKYFKHETHAIEVFIKELKAHLPELQRDGLFLSFTTDPMLPEALAMTYDAMATARCYGVPCKILTKCTEWVDDFIGTMGADNNAQWAFGFTLTGHDELEPGASTNAERIEAMRKLHDAGFKTFASIEPVIDFESSRVMIEACYEFCDLFKIGLQSGKKYYHNIIMRFLERLVSPVFAEAGVKFYLKNSLLKQARIDREGLPSNFVGRDYNLFKQA
jgi:DNA repair photolyase